MKKKSISVLLTLALCGTMLAGCGSPSEGSGSSDSSSDGNSSGKEVLEFYHGFYHDESEWAPAKAMRDIYDEFAEAHADGPVTFKPIPVENRAEITSTQVAGGTFPDMVDLGEAIPQAAISQGLVLDLKPYIDENNLQEAVGLNYTQNQVDGHIYTVHDQLENRGMWYNSKIFETAGIDVSALNTWEDFGAAMDKVRALGDGSYGYIAGQGSLFMMTAMLATSETGRDLVASEFTEDVINAPEFADAFKKAAAFDQANGSEHTTEDLGNMMDDFNKNGTVAVLFNGAWNASGVDPSLSDVVKPTIFPGNVSISSAGGGHTIASGMSEEKTQLALEFLAYMVSPEVQERIFTEVQATPCNMTVDLNSLAKESSDANTIALAEACTLVNEAENIVINPIYTWGGDVGTSLVNAFMECAVSGTDIDARFTQLQKELTALIA